MPDNKPEDDEETLKKKMNKKASKKKGDCEPADDIEANGSDSNVSYFAGHTIEQERGGPLYDDLEAA